MSSYKLNSPRQPSPLRHSYSNPSYESLQDQNNITPTSFIAPQQSHRETSPSYQRGLSQTRTSRSELQMPLEASSPRTRDSLRALPQAPNFAAPVSSPRLDDASKSQNTLDKLRSKFEAVPLPSGPGLKPQGPSIALSRADSKRAPTAYASAVSAIQSPILESSELQKLGRSSTSHLRTLSKIANESEDSNLAITKPEQEVIGLHGRRRLQRDMATKGTRTLTAPGYGGRTWMDQQRQFLQAYEYLCHIGEAKEWIEDVTHTTIPAIVQLEETLRDGVTLAEVVQALQPQKTLRIFRNPRLQFRHSDNIAIFFRFLSEVELPELFHFELVDLYEKKNIPKVIYCIHALSWLLFRKGIVDFRIGNLVGQLQFEHHELEEVQKGLDRAGVSMPNFSGMGESFGAAPEPEPVETEEERIHREMLEHEEIISDLQAQTQGALVRMRLGSVMQALWGEERAIVELQSRLRGDWARQISDYRLQLKIFTVRLQSAARGYLIRAHARHRESVWLEEQNDFVLLQSLVRARTARKNIQSVRSRLRTHEASVCKVQAAIRGSLKRWDIGDQMTYTADAEPSVVRLQMRIRGAIQRMQHTEQQNAFRQNGIPIVRLQAAARGMLTRTRRRTIESKTRQHEKSITQLQSLIRGMQSRQRYLHTRAALTKHTTLWTRFQAEVRRSAAETIHRNTQKLLQQHSAQVCQLQGLVRAAHHRKTFIDVKTNIANHDERFRIIQSVIRANAERKRIYNLKRDLDYDIMNIQDLQSFSRGYLVRQEIYNTLCELNDHESALISLQSISRALLVRCNVGDILEALEGEESVIIDLQAAIRGRLVRAKFAEKKEFYEENMKKVIKIQSFIRGKQQGQAYKSLTTGTNPPIGTVKNFVHLLNDNDFDFDEEVEFEKLRKSVVNKVSSNERFEQWIAELDAKIGLLAHNKIARDEIVKIQKHPGLQPGNMMARSPSLRDSFNLKSLNKSTRAKLELYQDLFLMLQTQPRYLARLFRKIREQGALDDDHKRLEMLVMSMFGFAQRRREEYFLLKLLVQSIREEVDTCVTLQDFVRGNFFFVKLFGMYTRVPRDRKFIRDLMGPLIKTQIIENEHLDLESDPLQIYRSSLNDEELRTGQRSSRNPDVSREQAIRDPQTREAFIHHLQDLRDIVDQFLLSLEEAVQRTPYGTRYLAQQMFEALCLKFPHEDRQVLLQCVGNWLWKTYFKPSVSDPETSGVVDRALDPFHKRNIGEFSKVIGQVAAGKVFGGDNVYLQPLNSYITEAMGRLEEVWVQLIDVQDPETHFDIDEFNDLYAKAKPTLPIKTADLFALHQVIAADVNSMCSTHEDVPLKEVIRDLGSAKANEAEIGIGASEITLTLNPRIIAVETPDAEMNTLFMETKRCVLYIIRVQNGPSLWDILVQPVSAEDEGRWYALVQEELVESKRNSRPRGAYTDSSHNLTEITSMTYPELKQIALVNILSLEKAGRLTRTNQYQDVLNAIALDIRTKHRRRIQRARELDNVRATLANLEEKRAWLEERLQAYNEVFEQNLDVLQKKRGKKKFLIPFTKQWDHERELSRLGRRPEYGSFKYTAEALYHKGVLIEWKGRMGQALRDADLTISSDSVNHFLIEGSSGSMMIPGATASFTWDDLIEAQYQCQKHLKFFSGAGTACGELVLDTKLFMQQVSKKFWKDN